MGLYEIMCVKIENFKALLEFKEYFIQLKKKKKNTEQTNNILNGKDSAFSAREEGSFPGLERSPGEGNDDPLQYSCLGNPMDRGVLWVDWWTAVLWVSKELDTTYQNNNKRTNCEYIT